jgi:hypothetical protein
LFLPAKERKVGNNPLFPKKKARNPRQLKAAKKHWTIRTSNSKAQVKNQDDSVETCLLPIAGML